MCEGESTFAKALELDRKVWEVLPKIQARKAKEVLELESHGLDGLRCGLELKFNSELYHYSVITHHSDRLKIAITECHWYHYLKKSDRLDIAPRVAETVCFLELNVWAREFGCGFSASLSETKCAGHGDCRFCFTYPAETSGKKNTDEVSPAPQRPDSGHGAD